MVWPKPDGKEEYYPVPSFATLQVSDLPASAKWYDEALGFRRVYTLPDGRGSDLGSEEATAGLVAKPPSLDQPP